MQAIIHHTKNLVVEDLFYFCLGGKDKVRVPLWMWWWEGWKGCAFEWRGGMGKGVGISFLLMEVDGGGRGQKKFGGQFFLLPK